MDTLIRAECAKLIEDWKQKAFAYDGLIYMMLVEEPGGVVPLYIGKAETIGKGEATFQLILKALKPTLVTLHVGEITTLIT